MSSSFALQSLLELSSRAGLPGVVTQEDKDVEGPCLCLSCYAQLEKIARLKTSLHQLCEGVTSKMKKTAELQVIKIDISGE